MIEGQTSIFEMLYPTFKFTKPIRLIEFFAGYGSQALALKYLGVDFEHWKICEWATKSIQAYKDLHFENDNTDYSKDIDKDTLIDILYELGISSNYNSPMTKKQIQRLNDGNLRKIYNNIFATHNLVNIQQIKGEDLCVEDTDKFTYLLTYSFPCQDLSLAGNGKGMSDTTTRSGLLWEVERVLTECKNKPQVLLMENVPQVHGTDNVEDFNKWQLRLEEMGYKNYWQDLIATDYGIPQTRNRCFMVSILGDYNYTFPKPIPLKLKLKDMLEDNVDEKYYLSDKMIECLQSESDNSKFPRKERFFQTLKTTNEKGIAATLCTTGGTRPTDNYIINKHLRETFEQREEPIKDGSYIDSYNRKIRDDDLASTLSTRVNSSNDTYIAIKTANKKGYIEANEGDGVDISSRMQYHRGTVQKGKTQTITTMGGENNGVVLKDLKIRKLTPKECFRLMGVKDEDFDKVKKKQSDSSLYHLAGDSIVVNVLIAIFREML